MGMGQYVFSSYFAQVEAGFIPDAEVNGHQVWGGYGGVSIDFLRERYTDKGILPGRPGQNDQKIVFSGRRLVHAEVGHDSRGHCGQRSAGRGSCGSLPAEDSRRSHEWGREVEERRRTRDRTHAAPGHDTPAGGARPPQGLYSGATAHSVGKSGGSRTTSNNVATSSPFSPAL